MIQKFVSDRLHRIGTAASADAPIGQPPAHASTDVYTFENLPAKVRRLWNIWHRNLAQCDSPYYHPEFTRVVSRVRNDVRIAVFRDAQGTPLGLLPFQSSGPRDAAPIGGRLNDFHGIVTPYDVEFDINAFLREAGVRSFGFHAANWKQPQFRDNSFAALASHEIDLSEGAAAWHHWAHSRSSTLRRQAQKTRALQRHIGPVRFVFDSDREDNLERLIELKRQRYQASNTFDILGVPWCQQLVRELFQNRTRGFRPVLSELWAGRQLIAVHFGMSSDRVMHYWFPVYNPTFGRYSPGTLMLLKTIETVGDQVRRIDLSYGDDAYKFKFSNARSTVAYGLVTTQPWLRPIMKTRYRLRQKSKQILRVKWIKRTLRTMLPTYGAWHYR